MVTNNNINTAIRPVGNRSNNKNVDLHYGTGIEFKRILEKKLTDDNSVKFSKHAQGRLEMREIDLTTQQKNRIDTAVNKAKEKGVKDSLVLMDNMAFIVNVEKKIVITAVKSSELKENVITNIDGAVFT